MSNAESRGEDMGDPLDVIRDLAPPVGEQPGLVKRAKTDLMESVTRRSRREAVLRRARRAVVPLAAAALLIAAAVAWVIVQAGHQPPLQCPDRAATRSVTGDPVVDCAAEWRRSTGLSPPPMTAYDNGRGGVHVLLEGEAVPPGYTALGRGPLKDGR